MIRIKRNSDNTIVQTLTAEEYGLIPDDRVELVQTIDGVTVCDGGRYPAGDKITVNVVVDAADYATLKQFWENRDAVRVYFPDGTNKNNCIMLIRNVSWYENTMLSRFKRLQLEFWSGNNIIQDD